MILGASSVFISCRARECGSEQYGGDGSAERLKGALQDMGWHVATAIIPGGDQEDLVDECQVLLVMCSPGYAKSRAALQELHAADRLCKKILPVWHSGLYPPPELTPWLGPPQHWPQYKEPLQHTPDFAALLQTLAKQLASLGCTPKVQAAPPPAPTSSGSPYLLPVSPTRTSHQVSCKIKAPWQSVNVAARRTMHQRDHEKDDLLHAPGRVLASLNSKARSSLDIGSGSHGRHGAQPEVDDSAGTDEDWGGVTCSKEGCDYLRSHMVPVAVALRLVQITGYDCPDDLYYLEARHMETLQLQPEEAAVLRRVLDKVHKSHKGLLPDLLPDASDSFKEKTSMFQQRDDEEQQAAKELLEKLAAERAATSGTGSFRGLGARAGLSPLQAHSTASKRGTGGAMSAASSTKPPSPSAASFKAAEKVFHPGAPKHGHQRKHAAHTMSKDTEKQQKKPQQQQQQEQQQEQEQQQAGSAELATDGSSAANGEPAAACPPVTDSQDARSAEPTQSSDLRPECNDEHVPQEDEEPTEQNVGDMEHGKGHDDVDRSAGELAEDVAEDEE